MDNEINLPVCEWKSELKRNQWNWMVSARSGSLSGTFVSCQLSVGRDGRIDRLPLLSLDVWSMQRNSTSFTDCYKNYMHQSDELKIITCQSCRASSSATKSRGNLAGLHLADMERKGGLGLEREWWQVPPCRPASRTVNCGQRIRHKLVIMAYYHPRKAR